MNDAIESAEVRIGGRLGDARKYACSYRDKLPTEAKRTYATWLITAIFNGGPSVPSYRHIKGNSEGDLLTSSQAATIRKAIRSFYEDSFYVREVTRCCQKDNEVPA